MNEEQGTAEIIDALEAAGLAETYTDAHGREVMRLTEEGRAMAQELGILEHGSGRDGPATADRPEEPESIAPLEFPGSFGTAVGAAMLGFEQALRSEPPPEILAGEHVPERGLGGQDADLVIEFPDDLEREGSD